MLTDLTESKNKGSSNNENDGMHFLPGLIGCSLGFIVLFSLSFSFVLFSPLFLFALLLGPNLDSCTKSHACRSLSVRSSLFQRISEPPTIGINTRLRNSDK